MPDDEETKFYKSLNRAQRRRIDARRRRDERKRPAARKP